MKKIKPFREAKKYIKARYIMILREKEGDFYFIIPEEIIKGFDLQIGDVAIFGMEKKNHIFIHFVKKNLYSHIKKIEGENYETRRGIKQTKKRKE